MKYQSINKNYQDILIDYKNEEVSFNSKIQYRIGDKSKKINLSQYKINKDDYLFPYLFWYFNWLHNDTKLNKKTLRSLLDTNNSLSNSPHPLSNRIINILLRKNLLNSYISLKEYNKYLGNCYKKLIITTEENIFGNHLIDNYISLIYLSKYFNNKLVEDFFSIKLDKLIGKDQFKENNPSYCRLIINKIDALESILGNNNEINKLKIQISKTFPFIRETTIPYYNDTYFKQNIFKKEKKRISKVIFNDKFLHNQIDKYSWFFLLLDENSEVGFNGHDHDISPSIQLVYNSKKIITNFGTPSYSNSKIRDKSRSRSSGGVFFSHLKSKIFIGNFRVLTSYINKISFHLENNDIVYNYISKHFKAKFIYKENKISFRLIGFFPNKSFFNFFSETKDWIFQKETLTYKNVCIKGLEKKPTIKKCLIYNGVNDKSNGFEVLLEIKNKIEIEVIKL